MGNNTIYKFFWCGDQSRFGGIGIMLAEKLVSSVISVKRYDHCCLQLRFLAGTTILNVICCHAPSGLSAEGKDTLYERLFGVVAFVPEEKMLVLGGYFNGHVGDHSAVFEGVYGSCGYGMRNQDGLRTLGFCVANKLAITNTLFCKNKSRIINLEVIIHRLTSPLLGEHN